MTTKVITTSSPAFISTCGRTINLESRLSGVVGFLRPDKLELRSRDEDNAPALSPPENDGDRADGEETFETVFLVELLLLLSGDKVVTFFEDEETDNVGLIEDFLTVSDLFIEDPVDVVRFRFADDTGTDFLVSERLALDVGFVATEGNELLLSSGADRLTGSTTE